MRTTTLSLHPLVSGVLVALLAGGCGASAAGSTAVVAPPVESTGEDPVTAQAEPVQALALEAVQEAVALVDAGDTAAAILRADAAYELMLKLPDNGDGAYVQAKQDIRLLVAEVVARAYGTRPPAGAAQSAPWDLALPITDNEHVQREIASFTTVERAELLEAYRRSGLYRPMMLAKLEAAGLPSQLSWLPLVESSFKVAALSRAGALGLWQFISSTGLRYGLGRDDWVEERLDPEKSTDAAIRYLVDLHRIFGDWPKALAAYNCGESRVQQLQARSDSQYLDFWDLYELLPRETRRYVPRLIAVVQIVENPAKYGVELPEPLVPAEAPRTIEVARSVKLDALESRLGMATGTLAALNPELRHAATPSRPYALRVPQTSAPELLAAIEAAPQFDPPRQPQYVVHRVRSGETLSSIAERYRASMAAIMRTNNLRSPHRIWPGQRLRIPLRG